MDTSLVITKRAVKKLDKSAIGWVLFVIIPIFTSLIPTSEVFTIKVKIFSIITLAAIVIFAFEMLPKMVVGLLFPIAYVITKTAPAEVVFSPWTTSIPWMFLGGLVLYSVLLRVGLLKRIAYLLISKVGSSYNKLLFGITITGFVMFLFAPGSVYIPMAALTYGICKALDLGKSKESAGIMLTGFFSSYMPQYFIYSSDINNIQQLGSSVVKTKLTFLEYFYHNMLALFWICILVFVASRIFKPSKELNAISFAKRELEILGKFTTGEKKAALVSGILMIYLLTGNIHGLDIAWGFPLAACLFFLPGIDIGKEEDLRNVNMSMLFFITSCLAIGNIANHLGLGQVIANLAIPYLSDRGAIVTLMFIWVLCVVTNFVLTPLAIYATYTVPLVQIAQGIGMNPLLSYYMTNISVSQVIFPYEFAIPMFYFSYGLIHLKDYMKMFGISMILNFIYMILIYIPYWNLIGLF